MRCSLLILQLILIYSTSAQNVPNTTYVVVPGTYNATNNSTNNATYIVEPPSYNATYVSGYAPPMLYNTTDNATIFANVSSPMNNATYIGGAAPPMLYNTSATNGSSPAVTLYNATFMNDSSPMFVNNATYVGGAAPPPMLYNNTSPNFVNESLQRIPDVVPSTPLYDTGKVNFPPRLNLSQGMLMGTIDVDMFGNEFYSFMGIPYAKPPVGALRFKVRCRNIQRLRTMLDRLPMLLSIPGFNFFFCVIKVGKSVVTFVKLPTITFLHSLGTSAGRIFVMRMFCKAWSLGNLLLCFLNIFVLF